MRDGCQKVEDVGDVLGRETRLGGKARSGVFVLEKERHGECRFEGTASRELQEPKRCPLARAQACVDDVGIEYNTGHSHGGADDTTCLSEAA